MSSTTRSFAKNLADWYWQHGYKRVDLPLNSWLDSLYEVVDTLGEIESSETNTKACMALWGPSQTGKSTLISSYIDKNADAYGHNSALHWPGGSPARFVILDKNVDATVLNPFRLNSDASGCVSRFVLRDKIPDPAHPVEIRLTTETQIMHALAMGYFSECTVGDPAREDSRFTPETFKKRLTNTVAGVGRGAPRREAYEDLRRFVDLVEILASSGHERFEGLQRQWITLRRELLECPQLLSDPNCVRAFAAEVLWDSKRPLTDLFNKFCSLLSNLRREWGDEPIFCSLEVAARLLDIGACYRLKQASNPTGNSAYKQWTLSLGWKSGAGSVQLGPNYATDGSHRLVKTDEDFGLLQGLVWELVIPLRREQLVASAPILCEFLEEADLLDFPGVANAYKKVKDVRLNLDDLANEDSLRLFTEIVKRGKTASIVMKYAETLGIDGFSILTKWGVFPAQPDQLISGIKAWWSNFVPDFNSEQDNGPEASPLPFNLVLTFCSNIVSDVIMNGIGSGLETTFKEQIGSLGILAEPGVVTQTFATNYFQFSRFTDPKKDPLKGTDQLVQEARAAIEKDPAFVQQFRSHVSKESFKAMIEDGGTDCFFRELRNQAKGSQRREFIQRRKSEMLETLKILIKDARPEGAGYNEKRKKELLAWKRSLVESLTRNTDQEFGVTGISFTVRQLLNVDATILKPVPLNLAGGPRSRESALALWEKQFQTWRDDKTKRMRANPAVAICGITDEAHLNRLLRYLAEAVPMDDLRHWLVEQFGNLASEEEAEIIRRFVAIKMTTALMSGSANATRAHRGPTDIEAELASYSEHETDHPYNYKYSPHYCAFIEPLLNRIEEIASYTPPGVRPKQPGDIELMALFDAHPELNL